MRIKVFFSVLLVSQLTFSQVGINTEQPNATLEIAANTSDITSKDGVLIPKLSGDQLKAKDAAYGPDQAGTLVYVTQGITGPPDPASKTFYVRTEGFYYLFGSGANYVWIKLNSSAENGLNWNGMNIRLGGTLVSPTIISGLTGTNRLSFRAANTEDAYINIGSGAASGTSGGVYFGNASHGVTRGFPTIGSNNHLGLFTQNGNLYLSTNGAQTGEFILADNGNVGIGLGASAPTTKLHVNAASAGTGLRLVDGSQGADKVLVSDENGNARWDTAHKAHLTVLTATNTSDITIAKHPNTTTVPGLEGFTAPATGKYIIYFHSFLQVDNQTGDKAFYFEVLRNGTKIKEPESYLYVSADKIMAVNVPVIIDINQGDNITFRFRDGLTFPTPVPVLRFMASHRTRNFIEILYMGR